MRILYTFLCCCLAQVVQAQFTATITAVGNTTFCSGDSVLLVGNIGDTYQWYQNGTAISGATNDTLVVLAGGSFEVEIDSAGNIDMSNAEVVTVNTVPAQPGTMTGPDTICVGSLQTYSVASVPGATSYAWFGVSSLGQYALVDTTAIPTLTGYVAPPSGSPFCGVSVRALNVCGASSYTGMQSIPVGPPQIGGSWTVGDVDVADHMIRVCPGSQYTLFPVMHGNPGAYVYTDQSSFQWYLGSTPIAGATGWEHIITHGGNYSVKIITSHCGTFTVPKKVYQDLPNSITISPAGPLSFCVGNATPLTVTFDMTGVSDPMKWEWGYFSGSTSNRVATNVYSILPDTSGSYGIFAYSIHTPGCSFMSSSNYVDVSIPPQLEVTQIVDTLFATPGYDSYQWFESGAPIAGATAQKHVLTVDGDYTVEGTFSNGCVETSNSFDPNFIPPPPPGQGEEEEETEGGVSIYPNPVTNNFTLRTTVPEEDATADISITDMTGRVLFKKTVNTQSGVVEEKISMEANIERFCILKVRSKGSNQKASFFKK